MSAPPIRIESKAWTDTRYTTLALELGLDASESDTALIRCAAIWRWQTEHFTDDAPTYSVVPAVVNGALKSLDGARALVAADLAELDPDGRLRIRGGRDDKGKSRIDWLYRERERNRAKGEKRHRDADRTAGRFATSRAPAAHQPDVGTPPAGDQPATSSLVSDLRSPDVPDLSFSRVARDPSPPAPVPPPVAAFATASVHVALAVELLNAARLEIDPAARPIDFDQGDEMALVGHLRGIPEDKREASIRHGVAAIAAAVKSGAATIGALRPGELVGPRSWRKWQAETVEPSARGRAAPPGRAPPRKTGVSAGFAVLARIQAEATEPEP